jgi:hypothetical protein
MCTSVDVKSARNNFFNSKIERDKKVKTIIGERERDKTRERWGGGEIWGERETERERACKNEIEKMMESNMLGERRRERE